MRKVKLFMVMLVILAATVNAQSTNHDPKLVGTWVHVNGDSWVFNADGTLTRGDRTSKYGAISGKLIIYQSGSSGTSFDYVISPDGKTLLIGNAGGTGHLLQKT
jgi:hypothetical protein